jgi:hypothetical protein
MHQPLIVFLSLLLAGCASSSVFSARDTPVSLQGWRSERIVLPPEFAPSMPPGEEILLFAPGMFEATADDFWSYAFLMQIEETGLNVQRLTQIFEAYYDGLLVAVGEGRAEIGDDPASVHINSIGPNEYTATIRLIDAFVTDKPVDLNLRIQCEKIGDVSTLLRVQASPQSPDHSIWTGLAAAVQFLDLRL